MAKKVVILGAGYAGVTAALHLNKKGKRDDLDITIIDRNPYHTLLTEIHEVAGNRQDDECMRIPLADIFRDTKVHVVTDDIREFDFDSKQLVGGKDGYGYDYLILAVGSSPAFYCIPGLEENAFTLWSLEDAIKIREHIKECFKKAETERDPAERRKLLTFVVAGAGFTGVEMAGELGHWFNKLCREHNISRKEVRLILLDMLKRVLPVMDEKNSAKAHRYMQKKLGVEIMLETAISLMEPGRAVTSQGDIETGTMIWCAGVCCNTDASGADCERVGGARRFKVDEQCRTGQPGVYAVGDCGGLTGQDGKPYPAMVENALQSAAGAADNILRDIRGKKQEKVEVKFHGIMVSIGNFFAVSDIMGKRLPSWMSMLMKYMVNAHYLFEIMGLRGPAKYLWDEVMERRQEQSWLEKNYTKRVQAWWLLPLRMFLGAYWVYEGVEKVLQGWFKDPKLAEYLGKGFSRGYDVVASASSSGQLRVDTLLDINLAIVRFFLGNGTQLMQGEEVASKIFARVDLLKFGNFDLIHWLMNGWVLSSNFWEMLFQIVIVVAEIVVGLMLLSGTFTFVASAVSLGLLGMFVTSTGLYLESWWMAFAGIATMAGAGRAFGMDYYLTPWYTRAWEYYWKNGKVKLFFLQRKPKRKQAGKTK